jgi:hypothetical protein
MDGKWDAARFAKRVRMECRLPTVLADEVPQPWQGLPFEQSVQFAKHFFGLPQLRI